MSRNDACQNLSERLWRHIFYNWRQRQTYFTQLFSMIKFSNAWYLLWSNHGCFILLSVFPVLDYFPSFVSSSQLQGFLVANTWQFICMKDVSQWAGHGLDHPSVSSVSQSPSGRKGPHEGLWSKKGQSWVQTMLHKAMSTWVLKVSKVITSSW